MKPAPFDYISPQSLEEALAALRQNLPEAKLLAGGQSLMPLLNFRLTKPKMLIDLNGIGGLDGIRETSEGLSIGAMARQNRIERSALVEEKCPVLVEAIRHIGHVAIRHRGTIGGSLVHADPAAELPAVALALDASFDVIRDGMARRISAEKFFTDYLTTALEPDEMLQRIILPVIPRFSGYAVEEIARRHGDFAIAGVVAVVEIDASGKIGNARIGLFGLAPIPVRARQFEIALAGQQANREVIRAAAALLDEVLDPPSDIHASSAYRKHVAAELTVRATMRAIQLSRERLLG